MTKSNSVHPTLSNHFMASKNNSHKKIAIVGAGITGLACAYYLADAGHAVTIFEREKGTGGLAGSASVQGVPIEKFYHHFFASDTDLLALAEELGVTDSIHFYTSSVGMYIGGKLYPFTTPIDLLKFTPLPFFDRIIMGMLTLYFIKRKGWDGLEKWTVKELFEKLYASRLYDIVWRPLLRMKFGNHADDVPATFLWGRINPRGRSRKGMGEKLGYFDHGYHTFFSALEKAVVAKGVQLRYEGIVSFASTKNGARVITDKKRYLFDDLIFTGSTGVFQKLFKGITEKLMRALSSINYQAINCMILEMSQPVSPFYWLNAVDEDISFIGCIEHTKLVSTKMYNGTHIMYVFNYLSADDSLYTMDPKAVYNLYTRDLKKIFPHFSRKNVIQWQLARNPYATPIYSGKYSQRMPRHKMAPHIYLANTTQVYPEDRNVNNGIVLARKVIKLISK